MRYQDKKFSTTDVHYSRCYNVNFYNTPLSCVVFDVVHPGLNLTDDGEWIPAPGFEKPPAN